MQPVDSVGLGANVSLSVAASDPVPVAVLLAAEQCQWSPCCSQPVDSVGEGATVSLCVAAPVPVAVTAPSE